MKRERIREEGDAPETEGNNSKDTEGVSRSTRGVLLVSVQVERRVLCRKKEYINIRTDEERIADGTNPSMAQMNGRAGKMSTAAPKKDEPKGDK
jgi:hypothetical protein